MTFFIEARGAAVARPGSDVDVPKIWHLSETFDHPARLIVVGQRAARFKVMRRNTHSYGYFSRGFLHRFLKHFSQKPKTIFKGAAIFVGSFVVDWI